MDEDDVYIVWIACHGKVYNKPIKEDRARGNIMLDQLTVLIMKYQLLHKKGQWGNMVHNNVFPIRYNREI